jgi:hypothetical protein
MIWKLKVQTIYKMNTLLCTRYAMKTYSNLYGNNMVFFFQYEIDFFLSIFPRDFFLSNIANEMRIVHFATRNFHF